jgi:hypothetical protein
MTKRVQMVTSDMATPANRQHKRPCGDCPFARASLRGWLGPYSAEEWLRIVYGEGMVECHTKIGPQCAGAAIYRRNTLKSPRDESLLRLPRNEVLVFASPSEFLEHHTGRGVRGLSWGALLHGKAL